MSRKQKRKAKIISMTPKRVKHITITPRNIHQQDYIRMLDDTSKSIIFAIGPAGSGKTLLATQWAIKQYMAGKYSKIVITRPNVAVDNNDIGFLPGDMFAKMAPWMMPILDVFKEIFTTVEVEKMIRDEVIEICPIAYIRGRTFKNAIVLVDEAQGTTPNSMLSILTRIGEYSKMLVTGDIKQSDRGMNNGLSDFLDKTVDIKMNSIGLIEFDVGDVVRHDAVKEILEIYDED